MLEGIDPSRTWLIACERSGRIRDAMRLRGIPAVSCDIEPTRAPFGPHLQCDVRTVLHLPWAGLIAHPVCKYLTNAGSKHLYVGGRRENGIDFVRWQNMTEAAAFYCLFSEAKHIPRRAVENPVMHEHGAALVGHRATQFVHPWWFGSPFQKATGFKLYGLPKLPRERTKDSYPEPPKQAIWLMGPSPDREEKRSETDPEVARAIAQYWGHLIFQDCNIL